MFEENTYLNMPAPKLSKPQVKKNKKVIVNWESSVKYVTGFNIQVSKDADFEEDIKEYSVAKGTLRKKSLKNVKRGTYYVRIQAVFEKDGITYKSRWSKIRKIAVKA